MGPPCKYDENEFLVCAKVMKLKQLLKWFKKVLVYFDKPPAPWGMSGGINIMMESREQVRQKQEQRELWEKRYSEIVKKHTK